MSVFTFKEFRIDQKGAAMKVGTDGVLLGAWANAGSNDSILDAGTGTGLIALMMAQRFPNALIDAIEIEENAYENALMNIANSKFGNRINVFQSSLGEWTKHSQKKYNLLICNPPYFNNGYKVPDSKRERARVGSWMPFNEIIQAFLKLGNEEGKFAIILPASGSDEFLQLASSRKIFCTRKTIVFSKPGKPASRHLLELEKINSGYSEDELSIENSGLNDFTDQYRQLTKDFYLNF